MVSYSIIEYPTFRPISSGHFDDDLNFEYGDGTTVKDGCGATLMDQFWYFGGSSANNRQVNREIISNREKT